MLDLLPAVNGNRIQYSPAVDTGGSPGLRLVVQASSMPA